MGGLTKSQYLGMTEKERRDIALRSKSKIIHLYAASDEQESVRIALLLNHSAWKDEAILKRMLRKEPIMQIRLKIEQILLNRMLRGS